MEVRNRFKGLDLTDRVPDKLWNEVRDIVQETGINHSHRKEMQKSKMAVWGGLTNSSIGKEGANVEFCVYVFGFVHRI